MSEAIAGALLEQVIDAAQEPIVIVRVDDPDWPVAMANDAFPLIDGDSAAGKPFADVIEQLCGRDTALEASETIRAGEEAGFPVEIEGREYLLALKPLRADGDDRASCYAVYCRGGLLTAPAGADVQHALLRAKRRIRDLARDDPATGLMNARAFGDTLAHDWAVAARERRSLAIVAFDLDDFTAYVDVFGRHASDSCLRRVAQAIRRCLRRASDVVARVGDGQFVVLSHATDADGTARFAEHIANSVRELGIHHPRSTSDRFVTVSFRVAVAEPAGESRSPEAFLAGLVGTD